MKKLHLRRSTVEALIFLLVLITVFSLLGSRMGSGNMLKTIMNTAHDLLLNTVFYLMGITVLTGALSKLMSEFGVVTLLERFLRPLMKPLYNLPGVAALGAVMTFLSDNPAIIALSKDKTFSTYFKKYQLISLTNFGTAFGMGFVVMITMIGYGQLTGALVGLFGAFCGSIISTRIMQHSCLKTYPELDSPVQGTVAEAPEDEPVEEAKKDGIFMRFLNAVLDGGKNGVELGLQIIPGVLIITTAVIMITFGAGPSGVYDGSSSQGVPILPWLAEKIHWVFEWLFGFQHMELIAFPMTALGAVGAALGLRHHLHEAHDVRRIDPVAQVDRRFLRLCRRPVGRGGQAVEQYRGQRSQSGSDLVVAQAALLGQAAHNGRGIPSQNML